MTDPQQDSSQRKHWVTEFIDMIQAGERRKRWVNALLVIGEVIPACIAAVALYGASVGLRPQAPPIVISGFVLAFVAVFAKVIKHYLDRREKEIKARLEAEKAEALTSLQESYNVGLNEGAQVVLSNWATVARHHEAGMEYAHRQLQEGMKFKTEAYANTDAIDSYMKAINAIFEGFYESHEGVFTVSLAVSNSARTILHLVRIEPGGRGRSTPLPRPYDLADQAWGMAEAFNAGQAVYTTDVRATGNQGVRGYLSVVNLPIKNMAGTPVGIVNVDSPHVSSFGSLERVEEVWHYCLPVLSSLSLCLSDPRIFKNERQ